MNLKFERQTVARATQHTHAPVCGDEVELVDEDKHLSLAGKVGEGIYRIGGEIGGEEEG